MLNLTYDYGTSNNGQIQAVHYYTSPGTEDATKSEYFSYDLWARLNAAHTGTVNSTTGWSLQWIYDRLGNRTQQNIVGGNPTGLGQPQFSIDANTNRITSSGFQYDAAGNLLSDSLYTSAYDGANRVIHVQQNNNSSNSASYTYFGPLRIKKTIGTTTTTYIYSGNKPIAEYVNGVLNKEYVYSGSSLLVTIVGGSATYHHRDHLSDRAETDANGNPARSYGHYPFGETWYESGTTDKWKFTTYERDGESNLDYAQFRYYVSGQGRLGSPDPLSGTQGNPKSWNRYAYAVDDPVNFVDPTGMLITHVCLLDEKGNETSFCIGGGIVDGVWVFFSPFFLQSESIMQCPDNVCSRTRWVPNPTDPTKGNWHWEEFHAFANNGSGFYSVGNGPGGIFFGLMQAGQAAINYINSQSVKENTEYAGEIYLDQNGIYSYTDPRQGDIAGSQVCPECIPGGTNFAADYHTHGGDSNGQYDDEHFSPQDKDSTLGYMQEYPAYMGGFLGTPGGRTQFYNGTCHMVSGPALPGCP